AAAGDAGSGGKTYKNQWLFLGARLGPSLRFYTPSGDTAFTGGDTYGISMDAGIQASVQIAGAFSIQAEAIFTWDRASLWLYIYNAARKDEDRYTRQFSGVSLQFPVTAKLNFYPGKWRVSPFFGAYFFLPLGELSMGSPYDEAGSYSYSVFPPLGLLGGVSAGIPLGPGIIFADLRYAADLGEPELKGGGEIETYRRHMLSLSFGYEFGFFRKR
ncbi:MAG: hypothetical protein LBT16_14565, partial [Treponema sp.]|nr:hypothetical protein [Treponema sp.]